MFKTNKYFEELTGKFQEWGQKKYFQLAMLNIFLVILVLLRSAGYFEPYFPITINAIVILGVLASIVLLRVGSSFAFIISFTFWILTAIFRILYIVPWAERTALYSFESFVIGVVHLILEAVSRRRR